MDPVSVSFRGAAPDGYTISQVAFKDSVVFVKRDPISSDHKAQNLFPLNLQVVLFVKQLHRDPLAVSACGFFPIDRQLIISMIVSMTTYYMVIIQLGPELGRLTASLFGLE
ncbi:uncharacterized protein LOC124363709 [Homalodisca vitripennis]|uniref:uncharacterized protein LOC124363709 n=1 Tax=Homalodisca vitripennis TaxID=197043 RepID=UPI001EEB1E60|nr:uncharacterized protein LOC124363709 [Homalodisca vitripennis]